MRPFGIVKAGDILFLSASDFYYIVEIEQQSKYFYYSCIHSSGTTFDGARASKTASWFTAIFRDGIKIWVRES